MYYLQLSFGKCERSKRKILTVYDNGCFILVCEIFSVSTQRPEDDVPMLCVSTGISSKEINCLIFVLQVTGMESTGGYPNSDRL